MSKITDFAEGKNCMARIPNVCDNDTTTTVWAHIRSVRFDAGTSKKPIDLIGLISCFKCHQVIDGREKKDRHGNRVDTDFIKMCAYEGHMESLMMLVKAGIVG